jgi:hypothetical protein
VAGRGQHSLADEEPSAAEDGAVRELDPQSAVVVAPWHPKRVLDSERVIHVADGLDRLRQLVDKLLVEGLRGAPS